VVWVLLVGRRRDAIPSCKSGRSTFSVDAILVVEMKCIVTQYNERDIWCRGRGDETNDSNGSKRGGVDWAVVKEDRHKARNFRGRDLRLT
jgi:hypothetical protein